MTQIVMPVAAPDRIYKAIRMALEDLAKVKVLIKQGTRKLDLFAYSWHKPIDGRCRICFAGCIMAQVLPDDQYANFKEFDEAWQTVFNTLDYCREGELAEAVDAFYPGEDRWMSNYNLEEWYEIAEFGKSQEQFEEDMKAMADRLEKVDL